MKNSISTLILLFLSMWLLLKTPAAIILTAAVLFHEIGHYLVLRWLEYKSSSMFFIPFLGGMVTYKLESTPVWKDMLLYLAGPVPGLLVGCGLLWFWNGDRSNYVFLTAIILLALNVFNLAPFEPMDGGKLFKLVLFDRFRTLECGSLVFSFLFWAAAFGWFGSLVFSFLFWDAAFGWFESFGLVSVIAFGSIVPIFVWKRWVFATLVDEVRNYNEWFNIIEESKKRLFMKEFAINVGAINKDDSNMENHIDFLMVKLQKPQPSIANTLVFFAIYATLIVLLYVTYANSHLSDLNYYN